MKNAILADLRSFKDLIDPKKAKWGGIPNMLFFALLAIILFVVFVPYSADKVVDGVTIKGGLFVGGKAAMGGLLRNNFLIVFGMLAVFGIFFGEIGDRIPGWNKYIGGGTILVFFMGSIMASYKWLPASLAKFTENAKTGEWTPSGVINTFYNGTGIRFLEIFIPVLIVGSVITVNRKTLLKSISRYLPVIIIGVLGALGVGIGVGLLCGLAPKDVILDYVLPIMGGGTGGGAIPMREMYENATGRDGGVWLARALAVLTVANIFAIIAGALLDAIGKKKQSLTGNGELLMGEESAHVAEEWETMKTGQEGFAAAFVFTAIVTAFAYALGTLWSYYLEPVLNFELHALAILVVLVILINVFNLVPQSVKAGCKSMQKYFVNYTIWILMFAVGTTTYFPEIISAVSDWRIVVVTFGIIVGVVSSIMLTSKFFKLYPVEATITAGLCMANRGGSGDVAVLGAAKRMELMSYAQISSRIGGAMMLIFAGVMFGILA